MRRLAVLFTVMVLLSAVSVTAQEGDAILGLWATDPEGGGGLGHVEIVKKDGRYFGTIIWLEEAVYPPGDPNGTPGEEKTDIFNPDPALRQQPVIGLEIAKDFAYKGDGVWHKGTIYDPDNGKTYKCKMKFGDTEKVLKVRGFIGFSMIGRTTQWTRVEDPE
jgi:uncharacterized protein (DUF2147 family)